MKGLQIAIFSLLLTMTITAHAGSDLDKRAAKCNAINDQMTDLNPEASAAEDAARAARGGPNDYDAAVEYRRLQAQQEKLGHQWQDNDCHKVLEQKKKQDSGLSN